MTCFGYPSTMGDTELDGRIQGGLLCAGSAAGYDFLNIDASRFNGLL